MEPKLALQSLPVPALQVQEGQAPKRRAPHLSPALLLLPLAASGNPSWPLLQLRPLFRRSFSFSRGASAFRHYLACICFRLAFFLSPIPQLVHSPRCCRPARALSGSLAQALSPTAGIVAAPRRSAPPRSSARISRTRGAAPLPPAAPAAANAKGMSELATRADAHATPTPTACLPPSPSHTPAATPRWNQCAMQRRVF